MQQLSDSKIQARVRNLLARKWVDLGSLTIGTVNGVVYLGGRLEWSTQKAGPGQPGGESAQLKRLDAELRAIPEVQDVVFQLQDRVVHP